MLGIFPVYIKPAVEGLHGCGIEITKVTKEKVIHARVDPTAQGGIKPVLRVCLVV